MREIADIGLVAVHPTSRSAYTMRPGSTRPVSVRPRSSCQSRTASAVEPVYSSSTVKPL
ncbi:hypothetical protein NKG94_37435 [Micromonospora sp. M12]